MEASLSIFLKMWLPADDLLMVPYQSWSRGNKHYKVASIVDNIVELVGCSGSKVYVERKQLISLYTPKGRKTKPVSIWDHINATTERLHLLVSDRDSSPGADLGKDN